MAQIFIQLIVILSVTSCSTIPESREPAQARPDEFAKFPKNPPFEVKPEQEARFRALWKRALCLYPKRTESLGREHLNRLFHHKIHGCLAGKLRLNKDRPTSARAGIFLKNGDLDVVLRYSNISQIDDLKPDLRGLGVKMSHPQYENLSQDFLVNDTRRHFASTPEEILEFNEYAARGAHGLQGYLLKDAEDLAAVFGNPGEGLKLLQSDPKQFMKMAFSSGKSFKYIRRSIDIQQNQSDQPLSLLTKEFHSRAPFMLGDQIIKYAVIPCGVNGSHPSVRSNSHLGQDLESNAKTTKLCLKLIAQFFESEKQTPLNDYTKEWQSPRIDIGRFMFKSQSIHTPSKVEACESMIFDPWQSLPEHRPVGDINKGRWYIYHASRLQSHPDTHIDVTCE